MHPLDNIRVVEFAAYLQGPMASKLLLDYGADVIKVEQPIVGDPARGLQTQNDVPVGLANGRNFLLELYHGNKKSIAVNLKTEAGKQIVYDLIKKSDVFISNYRKSLLECVGLDYKTLAALNPKLIYATANAFGPNGPDANLIGYDLTAEARSGMMDVLAQHGVPYWDKNMPVDVISSVLLATGVLLALLARERTGEGQEVNSSLMASAIQLMVLPITSLLWTGQAGITITRETARNPLYGGYYRCADGKWVILAMPQYDLYWPTFCKALGQPDLAKDPRFADWKKAAENCVEQISILDKIFITKTSAEWQKAFTSGGEIIFQVVKSIYDLPADPQVKANDYIVDFTHEVLGKARKVGNLIHLEKTPGIISNAAPELGQHTEEILLDVCGYSWEQIEKLRQQEAIP